MKDYRYILTPYKGPASRCRCPKCNQPRKFSLYIDRGTGEPVADHVGRCDREDKCGHHCTPRQYFADNPNQPAQQRPASFTAPIIQAAPRPVEYLPFDLVKASHRNFEQNHLWVFFVKQIGGTATRLIFDKYQVGTSKHWPGATAFWQVENLNQVRQCKVMLYHADTGRRVKKPFDHIAFMGKKLLGNPDAVLQQCFFGCHLLPLYPLAPVAIVESEKTAMYCAHYYPGLVWLATGGKQGCKWTEKAVFEQLRGRTVVLFPDLMATADWQAKAEKVKAMVSCKIHVSPDLEHMASDADKAAGLDLMDYLLQQQAARPGGFSHPIKKEPPPAPVPDGMAAPDPAPPMETASIIQAGGETGANDYFTFDWFVTEAKKSFSRSMVKNPNDYWPGWLQSYRPTLRRVGIDETVLRDALNL